VDVNRIQDEGAKVETLIDPLTKCWDVFKVRRKLPPQVADEILKITISSENHEDLMIEMVAS